MTHHRLRTIDVHASAPAARLTRYRPFASYSGALEVGVEALVFIVLIVNGFGEGIGWRRYAVERLSRDPALVPTAWL